MAYYKKLVRDNIPEKLDALGISYKRSIATEQEYQQALIAKLNEEVEEFTKQNTTEELTDVLEVIRALENLGEYKSLEDVRKVKLSTAGGFENRIILEGDDDK